jgi:paraquat-inducible protein B
MSAPSNHYKLGLFVILGFAGLLALVIVFGSHSFNKETVAYYTYFDESVVGLEVGAPVKFRGVTIGHVSALDIAPDHRHVQVKNELDVGEIKNMGLSEVGKGRKTRFLVPPDLRAQLGSQGITGVKFVSIDFFDTKSNPLPLLNFPVPENYIPAAASLMKNLEDTITKAMDKLPELVDAVVGIVGRVDRMLALFEKEQLPEHATATLASADQVMKAVLLTVQKIDHAEIPEKAGQSLDDFRGAVAKMNKVLDRLDGDAGVLASAKRAADSFGDVGRSANATTRDLDDTLRDISDAAQAIRSLAESLEKDPDMLIKGRASASAKGKSK